MSIKKEKINKFLYLSKKEVRDTWYREENSCFHPLRDAINCIDGIHATRPIYQPYDDKDSTGMCMNITVSKSEKLSKSLVILSRALDPRYGGPSDWECKLQHTDTSFLPGSGLYFIFWLDSGRGTRDKDIEELVDESNDIARNIMRVIDDKKLLTFFGANGDHITTEEYLKIRKIFQRDKKIDTILEKK